MSGSLSIKAKLAAVAIVAAAGAVVLAGFNLYSGRANSLALERVYVRNVHALVQLQKIDTLLGEVRFRVAGVLLDVMPVQGSLNHLHDARKELDKAWSTVLAAGAESTDTEQQRLLDEMVRGWSVVQATLSKIEQAYTAKNNAQLTEVLETDWANVHLSYVKPLAALLPLVEASAKATYEHSAATNRSLTGASIVLAVVLAGLILAVAAWVMRSIATSLRDAVSVAGQVAGGDLVTTIVADRHDEMGRLLQALAAMQGSLRKVVGDVRLSVQELSRTSVDIAQGNLDLSRRTEEQASSLEETASSIEELASSVKQNAENARRANQLAAGASGVAAKGGEIVGQVVQRMGAITGSSRKISDIIGVIDGIAFQTNILALNAAVEAARAGEQGRGFAVVAGEVRSLAQRSAEAAKEIKALIVNSVAEVESGSKLVDEAGRTMEEIVSSVKGVTSIMTEITAASQEQSNGIEQVSQAIAQMDHVTQQNAALVEEASAAAESMRQQAARLTDALAVFRVGADEASVEEGAPALASEVSQASRETPRPKGDSGAARLAKPAALARA